MPKNWGVDPFGPFWAPQAAILDFAGGAALQAVSEGPLRRKAGIFIGLIWILVSSQFLGLVLLDILFQWSLNTGLDVKKN